MVVMCCADCGALNVMPWDCAACPECGSTTPAVGVPMPSDAVPQFWFPEKPQESGESTD